MRYAIILLALLCGLAPSRGAEAPQTKKGTLLAVMDILNNSGELSAFVDGMPDMLITELLETGDVKLVERTKVQTAMKALKLETSGLTQERNLELGKWLGVDGILFGAFNRVGDSYRLDVRAIDVQTGEINVAASASATRQNLQALIPEIGKQLRVRLAGAGLGRQGAAAAVPVPAAPPKPAADSVPLELQYKMMVSLFSEGSIPHQRVRIYLDNTLLGVSGVVDGLNRPFSLYKGNIAVGQHTLNLIHGTVDKQGRWVRELANQPQAYNFQVVKGDRAAIQYRMEAHEDWFEFKSFDINYRNLAYGD
jgi:TolB-like protein